MIPRVGLCRFPFAFCIIPLNRNGLYLKNKVRLSIYLQFINQKELQREERGFNLHSVFRYFQRTSTSDNSLYEEILWIRNQWFSVRNVRLKIPRERSATLLNCWRQLNMMIMPSPWPGNPTTPRSSKSTSPVLWSCEPWLDPFTSAWIGWGMNKVSFMICRLQMNQRLDLLKRPYCSPFEGTRFSSREKRWGSEWI